MFFLPASLEKALTSVIHEGLKVESNMWPLQLEWGCLWKYGWYIKKAADMITYWFCAKVHFVFVCLLNHLINYSGYLC